MIYKKYEIWILCIRYYTVFYRIFKIRVFCIFGPWSLRMREPRVGASKKLFIKSCANFTFAV